MCIPACIRSFVTPLYDRLPTVIYRIWIRNNEGICNDISYHRWYLSEIKIKKKKIHKFKKLISSRNSKPFFLGKYQNGPGKLFWNFSKVRKLLTSLFNDVASGCAPLQISFNFISLLSRRRSLPKYRKTLDSTFANVS